MPTSESASIVSAVVRWFLGRHSHRTDSTCITYALILLVWFCWLCARTHCSIAINILSPAKTKPHGRRCPFFLLPFHSGVMSNPITTSTIRIKHDSRRPRTTFTVHFLCHPASVLSVSVSYGVCQMMDYRLSFSNWWLQKNLCWNVFFSCEFFINSIGQYIFGSAMSHAQTELVFSATSSVAIAQFCSG